MTGPTVRGRASICQWTLEFRFYDKAQCSKFIELYMNLECTGSDNIKYEVFRGDSLTLDEHWVTIEDGTWANNLTRIAQMLEKVDYNNELIGVEE